MSEKSPEVEDLQKSEWEIAGLHSVEDRKISGVVPEDHNGIIIVHCPPSSDPNEEPSMKFIYSTSTLPDKFVSSHRDEKLPALELPAEDIHVIISTKSGIGRAESVFENVVEPVLKLIQESATPRYNVVKTMSHETVRTLASQKLRKKADEGVSQTIILLSGDGGIVDLVNGLLDSGPPSRTYVRPTVFLFPLGTGNALFHSIHRRLPGQDAYPLAQPRADFTNALRTLLRGTPKPLPIFRAKFSPSARLLSNEGRDANPIPNDSLYGAIVASYGLHATLVADSDTTEWRKHGDKRFGLVAKELLSPANGGPSHAYKAQVILTKKDPQNDEDVETQTLERDEHGYVLLTLVSNLEKTFTISPASRPLDGQMRVVHFGPESGEEVMRIMGLAYQGGKHVEDASGKVGYEEVEGMRLEMKETGAEGTWRRVCIDGLTVRLEEGGWMDVSKVDESGSAIDVVVGEEYTVAN